MSSSNRNESKRGGPTGPTGVTGQTTATLGADSQRRVSIQLDVAIVIRAVFLPTNPNRMRGAHPEVVAAAKAFIAAVEAASR